MTREEIIKELKILADAFAEEFQCVPVCITEAMMMLERDGNEN